MVQTGKLDRGIRKLEKFLVLNCRVRLFVPHQSIAIQQCRYLGMPFIFRQSWKNFIESASLLLSLHGYISRLALCSFRHLMIVVDYSDSCMSGTELVRKLQKHHASIIYVAIGIVDNVPVGTFRDNITPLLDA